MKKIMMVSFLLTAALAVQAQMGLKVAPKMEKGMVKTYVSIHKSTLPSQSAFDATVETTYTVSDATADGYVMELTTKTSKINYDPNNFTVKLLVEGGKLMELITIRFSVDKDGKVLKILNLDEIKSTLEPAIDKLVNEAITSLPAEMSQAITKEQLKAQFMNSISEKSLTHDLQKSAAPLALNGKTVMTGAQEEFVSAQGLKMKHMFFVNGKNITVNSSLDMNKEEMKKYVLEQVEKMIPDQLEMVKQAYDQLQESGVLKIDAKETATYELADDGWVKTINCDTSLSTFGQVTGTVTTATLK